MNCANHPDRERTAFCQNCGKPLCAECVRAVGTSIFCEPCLAARVAGTGAPGVNPGNVNAGNPAPPPAETVWQWGAGMPPGWAPPPGPNPGLAALLGFIPGVGAMYNEQYAKGIVHLMVFAVLVSLAHEYGIFGLFVAGWVCYMVIEAHHTARARRDGTPLPNPFGLNDLSERLGFGKAWPAAPPAGQSSGQSAGYTSSPFTPGPGAQPFSGPAASFVDPGPVPPYAPPYAGVPPYSYAPPVSSWGAPQDSTSYGAPPPPPVPSVPPMPPYPDPNLPYTRRFPAGAIWLIALGLIFLFSNSGLFFFPARYFGPFLLIGVGVWLFVRAMTSTGKGLENDGTPYYRWRLAGAVRGSFWVFLTGIIWLLDVFGILSWGHSWPLFIIGAGLMHLFRSAMASRPTPNASPYAAYPYSGYPNTPPPAPPVATTAMVQSEPHSHSGDTADGNPEGR
jgi:hypothetical protein